MTMLDDRGVVRHECALRHDQPKAAVGTIRVTYTDGAEGTGGPFCDGCLTKRVLRLRGRSDVRVFTVIRFDVDCSLGDELLGDEVRRMS